jgi:hypothetical protein
MTISTSSRLISIFDLNREFGSNTNLATCGPISLSQFYRNSKYVPTNPFNSVGVDGVLTSKITTSSTGTIRLNDFSESHGKLWNNFHGDNGENSYGIAPNTISPGVYTVGQNYTAGVLRKWDHAGNLLWNARLATSTETYTRWWGVSVDSTGNAYVVGIATEHSGAILVAKYTTLGALVWQKIYRAATDVNYGSMSIKIHGSGTQYIYVSCTLTAQTSPSFLSVGTFLLKLDTDGAGVWSRRLDAGGPGTNYVNSLNLDSSSNVYVVGTSVIGNSAPQDGYIAKYNSSGVLQWQNQIRAPNTQDNGVLFDVAFDSSGNIYAVGGLGRLVTFSNIYSLYVFKFDPTGALVWQRKIGGTENNDRMYGNGITIDSNDDIYISGIYFDYALFTNVAIYVKYNTSGVLQWQRYFGGYVPPYSGTLTSGGDNNIKPISIGKPIAVDTNNSLYINYTSGFLTTQPGLLKAPTVHGAVYTGYLTAGAIYQVQNRAIISGGASWTEAAGTSTVTSSTLLDQAYAATTSATSLISVIGTNRSESHPLSTTYFGIIFGSPLPTYQISAPKMQVLELTYYTQGSIGPLATSQIYEAASASRSQVYAVGWGDQIVNGTNVHQLAFNNSGVMSSSDFYGGFGGSAYLSTKGCAVSTNSNFVTYMAEGSVAGGGGSGTLLLSRRTTDSNTTWSQTEIYSAAGDYIYGASIAVDNWAYGGNTIVASSYYDNAATTYIASIVSVNNTGAPNWQRKLSATNASVSAGGSTVDFSAPYTSTNLYYIAGHYSQPKFPATPTQFGIFLAQYDYFGTLQWQRVLTANNYCYAGTPFYDKSSGCVYVTGKSLDSISNGSILAKYNASGTLQWQRVLNVSNSSYTHAVTDWNGNIYAVGTYGSTPTFIHLVKYNSSGVIQWRKAISGDKGSSYWTTGLTMDYMGILWISGYSSGTSYIIKIDPTATHADGSSRFRTVNDDYIIADAAYIESASTLTPTTGSLTDAAGSLTVLTAATGYSGYTSYNTKLYPFITTGMVYANEVPSASSFTANIVTNQQELNLRTWALANGWNGTSAATVTIGASAYIWSDSTSIAALTINGSWPGGVTVINSGIIMGKGGAGANVGSNGNTGGPAISLGVNATIINNSYVGGGGGGGGGGALSGGGGGAGGGVGGLPSMASSGGGVGGTVGSSGGDGIYYMWTGDPPGSELATYAGAGGGGGRIFPGVGGAPGSGYTTNVGGKGGGAGGGAGHDGGWGASGAGSGGSAGATGSSGSYPHSGGGGGWGAAGGNSGGFGSGAAGGKAINLSGYTVTYTDSGTTYGSVS